MIFSSPESALNALKTLSKDKQILIDYRNDCDVLRAKIESISSPTLSSEPHGSIPPGTNGDLIAQYLDMQKTLQIKVSFYREKLEVVNQILIHIPQRLHALTLSKRYILGLTWPKISDITGYSQSHLYKLHRDALESYVQTYIDIYK